MSFYKEFDGSVLNKKEFKLKNRRPDLYQEPHQMLLRNFVSRNTVYDNLLVYHALGTGKTCTSITIAEGFKEYLLNMNRKVLVLVKNDNIKQNFINELTSMCTNGTYTSQVRSEIDNNYWFLNYITFVNRVTMKRPTSKPITNLSNTVIIVDEAHNITNNDIYSALHYILSKSQNYRLVLLTATPIRDNPKEIFEISNILNVTGGPQFPIRNQLDSSLIQKAKNTRGIFRGSVVKLTDLAMDRLGEAFRGKVSFLQSNLTTAPRKKYMGTPLSPGVPESENIVVCEMTEFQYTTYKKAIELDYTTTDTTTNPTTSSTTSLATNPTTSYTTNPTTSSATNPTTSSATENLLDQVTKGSAVYKNSLDASFFVYPDGQYGKRGFNSFFRKVDKRGNFVPIDAGTAALTDDLRVHSTKLYKLLQNIRRSEGPVFVYSNFVNYAGTSVVKQVLIANGYQPYNSSKPSERSFIVMDETTRPEMRERLRRVFNSNENANGAVIRVLIGSPVISEGITLKNVRQVHIIEPTWNKSRLDQVIGRAVRNYSHHILPESQRIVEVYKYVSVYTPDPDLVSIDKEMYNLIYDKDRNNKLVERLLKQVSFDCHILRERNTLGKEFNGSPECDYTDCNITCKYEPPEVAEDTSSYDYFLRDIEQHDIEYVSKMITEIFKVYFFWKLNDIIDYIKSRSLSIPLEVIYTVLGDFVESKRTVRDQYDREGYIIHRGEYYIFNLTDAPIDSSVYSRMLDFWVYTNDITFDQFTGNQIVPKEKGKKRETPKQEKSSDVLKYNESIQSKYAIYGTYSGRDGVIDNKFRVVIDDNKGSVRDKRKKISGMAITSFRKEQLENIAQSLGIPVQQMDKKELETAIQQFLIDNQRVLQ